MKKGIHPQTYKDAKTTCTSCGAVYKIPTTVKDQTVEVCGACHPVYTGEYRGIMSSGRVDRFRKMQAASKQKKEEKTQKQAMKAESKVKKPAAKTTKKTAAKKK